MEGHTSMIDPDTESESESESPPPLPRQPSPQPPPAPELPPPPPPARVSVAVCTKSTPTTTPTTTTLDKDKAERLAAAFCRPVSMSVAPTPRGRMPARPASFSVQASTPTPTSPTPSHSHSSSVSVSASVSRRYRIVEEMLETERIYVKAINSLRSLYITPIQQHPCNAQILKIAANVAVFYDNVTGILERNCELLANLEDRVVADKWDDHSTCLGHLFTQFAAEFDGVYGQFAANCKDFLFAVSTVSASDSRFAQELKQMDRASHHSLSDLVIRPIQRLPRYALLLKDLVKHTPAEHADHDALCVALDEVTLSCVSMDKAIAEAEERVALLAMERRWIGKISLVAPKRSFVKEGTLKKKCRGGNRDYIFHLFSDLIVYSETTPLGFKLHRMIDLRNCVAHALPDGRMYKHAFEIKSPQKSFVVICVDDAERDTWVQAMLKCMQELQNSAASPLSPTALAATWVGDKEHRQCQLCTVKFTAVRRRHHCRSCGRLVCGNCSPKDVWRVLSHISSKPIRVCRHCHVEFTAPGATAEVGEVADEQQASDDGDSDWVDVDGGDGDDQPDTPSLSASMAGADPTPVSLQSLEVCDEAGCGAGHAAQPVLTLVQDYVGRLSALQSSVVTPLQQRCASMPQLLVFLSSVTDLHSVTRRLLASLQSISSSDTPLAALATTLQQYAKLFRMHSAYSLNLVWALGAVFGSDVCDIQQQEGQGKEWFSLLTQPLAHTSQLRQCVSALDADELMPVVAMLDEQLAYTQDVLTDVQQLAGVRTVEKRCYGAGLENMRLVATGRKLLKEGKLLKLHSRGGEKTYTFHAFNDLLMYSEETSRGLDVHRVLPLRAACVVDVAGGGREHVFEIRGNKKEIQVSASSALDKEKWVRCLQQAIVALRASLGGCANATQAQQPPQWSGDVPAHVCVRCSQPPPSACALPVCGRCSQAVCGECSSVRCPPADVAPPRVCCHCVTLVSV